MNETSKEHSLVACELPISRPDVFGFNYYGLPLAIMATQPESQYWYVNLTQNIAFHHDREFPIQLCILIGGFSVDSPWLEHGKIEQSAFAALSAQSVSATINSLLAAGHYPQVWLDEYYVPASRLHSIEHFDHEFVVHSSSSDGLAVFGMGRHNTLESLTLSWQTFEIALSAAARRSRSRQADLFREVHIWRLRSVEEAQQREVRPLEVDGVRRQIEAFLNGTATDDSAPAAMSLRGSISYGVSCYDALREDVGSVDDLSRLDRRSFASLRDRAMCVSRLRQVVQTRASTTYLPTQFSSPQIVEATNLLRLASIAVRRGELGHSSSESTRERLIFGLYEIERLDRIQTESTLGELSQFG